MAIEAKAAVPSAAANGKHGHSLISDAKFRQLYGLALRLRLTARRVNGAARDLRGREAALAGVTADLRGSDGFVADLELCATEILSTVLSRTVEANGTGRFEDRVISALSTATGDRLRGNDRVTVIVAQKKSALMQEAHAMAAGAKLPVLFLEREAPQNSSAAPNSGRSQDGAWMPAIHVDAQDVVALYRVSHESMERARQGGGPTRILCAAWHPARQDGRRADAVLHLERWLEARGLPAQQWRREIAVEFEKRG